MTHKEIKKFNEVVKIINRTYNQLEYLQKTQDSNILNLGVMIGNLLPEDKKKLNIIQKNGQFHIELFTDDPRSYISKKEENKE